MRGDPGVLLSGRRSSEIERFRSFPCGNGADALTVARGCGPPTVPITEHWFDKALMLIATVLTVCFGLIGVSGAILALLTIARY
jgi:hypothetical protein